MISTTDLALLEDKVRYGNEWERFTRGDPEHDPTDVTHSSRHVMRRKVIMTRKTYNGLTIAQWVWERWAA